MGGGDTQIAMRGVGASGPVYNASTTIGYYLDGVPIAQIRQAVVPDANAFDLERLEVLRGPQGTLYGVNAENGLVRVLTHKPDLNEFEIKARTTLSSTDQGGGNYRGDMAVNVPIVPGKLGARAVVGYQSLSGWIDQPTERDINDTIARNYRLKVLAQPTDALSVGITAWRSNKDSGAPSISGDDGLAAATLDQPVTSDFEVGNLEIGYRFSRFAVSSMTSYVDYSSLNTLSLAAFGDLSPGGGPDFTREIVYDDYGSRTFSQEILVNSTLVGPWRWTAGAFYRDTNDRVIEVLDFTDPVNAAFVAGGFRGGSLDSARSYTLFGEVSRRFFGDRLQWTLGGRYFEEDLASEPHPGVGLPPIAGGYSKESSSHTATPRAVLTWYPSDDFTAYASYSEGFRSIVPNDRLAPSGLPELKPDKLHNFEIGAKGNVWDGHLAFDASVYYIDWNDTLQTIRRPVTVGGVEQGLIVVANSAGASGPGVDLGLTAHPFNGLNLGVNVSWNDLEFDGDIRNAAGNVIFGEGERLAYSSEWTLGASADYVFPMGASGYTGTFSTSGNYSSRQISRAFSPAGGVAISRGDNLLISRASFAIGAPGERWTAMLFVDNLNDEDGVAAPSVNAVPAWKVRLRPRTIGVQFDVRF
jgi:iron complex outermembrane recepter protein